MMTTEQFKGACAYLRGTVDRQRDLMARANVGAKSDVERLGEASVRLQDDTLRVLVMGIFNAGKSSFLNTLMGKDILPTRLVTTTGTMGEIIYSETPQIVLYPRKGTGKSDKPFTIKAEQLADYITIKHEFTSNGVEKKEKNPYEKVIIKYPIEICRKGIMLVDSVGLEDADNHSAITEEYIPNADAIIYCVNGTQTRLPSDLTEIEKLRAMGYKEIMFVITRYDSVMRDPYSQRVIKQEFAQLTDLGEDGVFFVDNLWGLDGKLKGDSQLLDKSGFPLLERKLVEFLVNQKGRLKLLNVLVAARQANRETGQQLSDLIDVVIGNQNGVSIKVTDTKNSLEKAKNKAESISKQFRMGNSHIVDGAKSRAKNYIFATILPNIQKWVEEFSPAEGQRLSILHPKDTATAFTEGCLTFVKTKMETTMANWCQEELIKGYIHPQLSTLLSQQQISIQAYDDDLRKIRTAMKLSISGQKIVEDEDAGNTSRVLAAIIGALIATPTAVGAAAFGFKGFGKAMVSGIIGAVIAIIALAFANPVIAIVAWVAAAIMSGLFGKGATEKSIKKKIADKLREEISAQKDKIADGIADGVAQVTDKIQAEIENRLFEPVESLKAVLAEVEKATAVESTNLGNRLQNLKQWRVENNGIAGNLDALAQDMNV